MTTKGGKKINIEEKTKFNHKLKKKKLLDRYGILAIINSGKEEKTAAFAFNPYISNDILTMEYTNRTFYLLLKNGNVLSYGEDSTGKIVKADAKTEALYVPRPLKFSLKIVDISCGNEHCLIRGDNYKVYSWGSNSYGQLGLFGFPMNPNSEKEEPVEIAFFLVNLKIIKILEY